MTPSKDPQAVNKTSEALTKEEFIKMYCDNSSVGRSSPTTWESLYELGMRAVPCDCDSEDCKGWAMGSVNDFPSLPS